MGFVVTNDTNREAVGKSSRVCTQCFKSEHKIGSFEKN